MVTISRFEAQWGASTVGFIDDVVAWWRRLGAHQGGESLWRMYSENFEFTSSSAPTKSTTSAAHCLLKYSFHCRYDMCHLDCDALDLHYDIG